MSAYNPFSLQGKRVLVTGASSGFGRAITLGCASMGAELIATGRNVEHPCETLEQLKGLSSQGRCAVIAGLRE